MDYFYFGTMRRMVGGVGTIFSDIHIKHQNEYGVPVKNFKVPLNYGPKNVWLEKMKQREREQSGEARTSIKLPRITFEMGSFQFANDRAVSPRTRNMRTLPQDLDLHDKVMSQLQEIPYDFSFKVIVYAKNMEDGLQIIEQILPNFRPNFLITINEIPELNIHKDINIDLVSVDTNDTFEGSMNNMNRVLTWELTLIAHGYVFPPIKDAQLIREVRNAIHDANNEQIGDIDADISPNTANEDEEWLAEVSIQFPNE